MYVWIHSTLLSTIRASSLAHVSPFIHSRTGASPAHPPRAAPMAVCSRSGPCSTVRARRHLRLRSLGTWTGSRHRRHWSGHAPGRTTAEGRENGRREGEKERREGGGERREEGMDTSRVNRWKQTYDHFSPPPFLSLSSLSAAASPNPRTLGWLMLAKWAAWPASCINVVSAFCPDPTAEGSARDVKLASDGCHEPSPRTHATCGQWQKPFEYFPLRSSRSSTIFAPLYWIPIPAKDRPHRSTAASKGKNGSSFAVTSPDVAWPMFHGSSASAPWAVASFARASSISPRVPSCYIAVGRERKECYLGRSVFHSICTCSLLLKLRRLRSG